ncbi:MAG: hypothetical protein K8F91_03885, partial [Candidatus Obscuribacterales bacterium]|nr:hypothetical protein [Candidatus Obscuribacterales bacterium]
SGIGAVVLTTMVAISYRKMVVAQVSKQLELAPAVVKFALANFDRMVSENSEVLTSAILWALLDEGRVAKADREIVEHMAVRISDIGHVIDVAYASAGYHSPGAVYNVYGISRQDLVTYEARLKRNYSGWIG